MGYVKIFCHWLVAFEEFQQEKLAVIKQIAETPFEIFETIIRETVTSNFAIHQRIMMEKCLSLREVRTSQDLVALREQLKTLQKPDHSADHLGVLK